MTSHVARRPYLSLAPFAAAVAVAALVGGLGVAGTASEYQSLQQPSWAPPSWLFGPVWTLLYVLIAVAGWLVWRRVGWTPALTAYGIQLVLNAVWTPIFFGFGQYGLALADIIVLWLMIGVTIVLFRPVSRLAAGLMLPYWAWVTFATALNAWIWHAN
ncbi:TspO/MBR family protein [Winogradskya humida]|uniref:TspO/MBR-related protein n=1 Tax=Winogradskya humida TaxID=113566 RepID=A0ABQ3ZTX0_9ACTN|nr:TspO/MBR family protein [Actinoplanes humidus]GIE21908.1 putative TspO/MBR-related protein precursor [Actinoplanes humidus]